MYRFVFLKMKLLISRNYTNIFYISVAMGYQQFINIIIYIHST